MRYDNISNISSSSVMMTIVQMMIKIVMKTTTTAIIIIIITIIPSTVRGENVDIYSSLTALQTVPNTHTHMMTAHYASKPCAVSI